MENSCDRVFISWQTFSKMINSFNNKSKTIKNRPSVVQMLIESLSLIHKSFPFPAGLTSLCDLI